MKNLRRDFERFCYRHQRKGIPNLMLFVVIGTAIVYFFSEIDPSGLFYRYLSFDRSAIFHGQIWRLASYIFLPSTGGILWMAIWMLFYYQIGRELENRWGTFRFNLYYFSGVLIMDIAALLLNVSPSVESLHMTLLLASATVYPDATVMIYFIIPLKMKYLAWIYAVMTVIEICTLHGWYKLFPICALLNYFLFFGSDVQNVLPDFMKPRRRPKTGYGDYAPKPPRAQKPNPNWVRDYRSKSGEQPYRHKCAVCGRTDVSDPMLEFRYCSRCNGYYCYCMEHINNHAHIE